ncbi:dihydrofolate reductase [Myxococcota bacterium]|nr:dihydrofolate reductase [Myxococcota bacterium]
MSAARIIGHQGRLPWRCPADMAHFRRSTLGKPVIMGRLTFESLGGPLPGRRNLVLSRRAGQATPLEPAPMRSSEGVEVCGSLEAALRRVEGAAEVMIIGGQAVYTAALPRATRALLTVIEGDYEGDRWFPALGAGWRRAERVFLGGEAGCGCWLEVWVLA